MTISELRASFGDFAKDTKINLGTVLTEEGAPDLTPVQIYGISLASAYSIKNFALVNALRTDAMMLSEADVHAAKAAATIMAMNNVYYRFSHVVSDPNYAKMPAKLRMGVIGAPGVAKVDFELMCLAVSAINGCAMCIDSHVHEVIQAGISPLGVQSCIRISAVITAASQALAINGLG